MREKWKDFDLNQTEFKKTVENKRFDPVKEEAMEIIEEAENGNRPDNMGTIGALAWSFAESKELYKNFPDNLREFDGHDKLEPMNEFGWYLEPDKRALFCTVFSLYKAAEDGDENSKKFLKKLYRAGFKKEYDILRRMNTMSSGEFNDIANLSEVSDTGRVIGMANIMDITLDPKIALLEHGLMQWWAHKEEIIPDNQKERSKMEELGEKTMAELDSDNLNTVSREQDAIEAILASLGYFNDAAEHWSGYKDGKWKKDIDYVAGVLKDKHPGRKYKISEYHTYAKFYRFIRAFKETTDYLYDIYTAALCPPREGLVKQEEAEDEDSETEELKETVRRLEKENKDLSFAIERKEEDIKAIAAKERNAIKRCEGLEDELEKAKENDTELFKLREYAYSLTEEEEVKESKNRIKDSEEFLRDKKIVIIGGHERWHRTLKEKFPKWKYYGANADPLISLSSLSSADMIFFYTGYLGHVNYYKSIGIIRKNNLNFGYINTTNYEKAVKQIHKSLKQ